MQLFVGKAYIERTGFTGEVDVQGSRLFRGSSEERTRTHHDDEYLETRKKCCTTFANDDDNVHMEEALKAVWRSHTKSNSANRYRFIDQRLS